MKNLKNKFILASAILALASCADNSYLGENEENPQGGTGRTIAFGSSTGSVTRATKNTGTTAEMLDGQFKVYGVKNVKNGNSDSYSTVFLNYVVFNNAGKTTSNPDGDWEYVGNTNTKYGESQTSLTGTQTIKYWDFAADNYHFVAGSPVSNFTYNITSNDIASATVTGFAGHINANTTTTNTFNPVYIAKPVNVPKESTSGIKIGDEVTFNFVRQQTFVRVGIYETIPGYKITNIKFYPYDETSDAWGATSSENITLASTTANYFIGGNNVSGTITYDWTTPSYTFTYDDTNLTKQKNWYGGKLNNTSWEMATSSVVTTTETDINKLFGTDNDRDANGYFIVLPTPSAITTGTPLMIKCDYTLTSDDASGEEIKISGATAAIPAAYSLWKPNFKYTYLFKITDDKLTPITFDALVVVDGEGNQETITTVSEPSITTYANSSNILSDGEYKENTDIYVAVMDGKANPALVVGNTDPNAKLYTVTVENGYAQGITEASVANALVNGTKNDTNNPTTWTVTDGAGKNLVVSTTTTTLTPLTTIPSGASPTKSDLTINVAKFNPGDLSADTYYVFEYATVYTPIVGDIAATTGYYTISNGAYTGPTNNAVTAADNDGKTYYQKNTGAAVKKYYKVIKVVAAP